ncbi:LytS/YhcK type 5TM receptor domain-containing protein [Virgibacillus sp. 179-BFC.A HS]|uniref:LytS/YhcK type 5TM receptor domain-containing protein n=1 Tax=Tigheibacillus jepli TaxID=3035914 RepID=A0ABU5CJE7_9BACI|nr:LytS/YhcK type 5TM receptor domain-containing protein [Virgibacillus sp. 179-BFC.A HS]MDY0406426.1 LytS/YhcK type 5TM receptor domain-containing protein [Virgibacillus sp. 179-BFC.A HS]
MKEMTIILFERLGLLLVIAFVMTRTPGFKTMLYREFSWKMAIVHSCVFGIFGIASTITGFVLDGKTVIHDFVWHTVGPDQLVVSSSLMAIVIAGLLGGPVVGFGAGMIAGIHLMYIGGIGWLANGIVNPLTGLLAGWTARFFSDERVISPWKALFIGIFPPVLQMQLLLILQSQSQDMVGIVDMIGLPLVLSNSIAIAIFTAMIVIVLREQEDEAAKATKQAFSIAEEALPFIKEEDATEMATGLAKLLYDRLDIAAVAITNRKYVLAHVGIGAEHHRQGDVIAGTLTREVMAQKRMLIADSREKNPCSHPKCQLEAAIIIPILEANEVTRVIYFYFRKVQHIRPVERMVAAGLGEYLCNQLKMLAADKLKAHMRDAELRNLQAQINPHFLFNTLHLIAASLRKDPEQARHITVQLAQFMRFNLKLVANPLVTLEKECEHVQAYLEIIRARFMNRLHTSFTCDTDVLDVLIPPATIQPLVENCIQHGLSDMLQGAKIAVNITNQGEYIHVSVYDNGCGFRQDLLDVIAKKPLTDEPNHGTGLYNVNQRLTSLLGEDAGLIVRNLPGQGSEVRFSIPVTMHGTKAQAPV